MAKNGNASRCFFDSKYQIQFVANGIQLGQGLRGGKK